MAWTEVGDGERGNGGFILRTQTLWDAGEGGDLWDGEAEGRVQREVRMLWSGPPGGRWCFPSGREGGAEEPGQQSNGTFRCSGADRGRHPVAVGC